MKPRELTPAEQTELNKLVAQRDALLAEIEDIDDQLEMLRASLP